MRQNSRSFFHKCIIASLCCMALAGCGHKTTPKFIDANGTLVTPVLTH